MSKLDQLQNQAIEPQAFEAPTGVIEVEQFRLQTGHWVLIGLACLALLFMTFITVARSIQIVTVTPEIDNQAAMLAQPADIEINAFIKLPIGNRTLVLPGAHSVTAKASGFVTTERSIEVARDRHQNFEVILLREDGLLDIQLDPSVGAMVLLDGEPFGELPGIIRDVPAGRHEIVIDAPLYRPASRSVVVEGRGETQSLRFTLDPAWANLNLASAPSGAAVIIDDQVVGKTPIQIRVEEGTHILRLEADKFKAHEQDFSIIAQQDLAVEPIELALADGTLELSTRPQAAAIIVNGEYQGVSPMTLELTPNVEQRLQLYRAGYRLKDQSVTLAPAAQERREYVLKQDTVAVQISVTPKDAELIVDGVSRGRGSKTLQLSTLPHNIVARKAGYVDYQNTIIPTRASNQIVSIAMLTKEESFWASVPNVYTSSEGHEMMLFKSPGTVKLGSSRRETDRRSNETLYTAQLKKHFYVSQHEVTNKQFRQFKSSHSSGNYKRRSLDSNKHPVVNISWQDAARYCNWLSKKEGLEPFYTTKSGYIAGYNSQANGYRLPTEHEWAWLARNKGDQLLTYSWAGALNRDSPKVGNFADKNAADFITFTLPEYDDGYKASSPVGRFPPNHRGIYDMAGNVAEWINDWYSANSDLAGSSNLVDFLGPEEGEFHVIRGASWARGHLPQLRLAYRDFGAKPVHDVGFRIARYVGQPR